MCAAQACNEDVEKLCGTLLEGESALSCLRYDPAPFVPMHQCQRLDLAQKLQMAPV